MYLQIYKDINTMSSDRTCYNCGTVWEDRLAVITCPCLDGTWIG